MTVSKLNAADYRLACNSLECALDDAGDAHPKDTQKLVTARVERCLVRLGGSPLPGKTQELQERASYLISYAKIRRANLIAKEIFSA